MLNVPGLKEPPRELPALHGHQSPEACSILTHAVVSLQTLHMSFLVSRCRLIHLTGEWCFSNAKPPVLVLRAKKAFGAFEGELAVDFARESSSLKPKAFPKPKPQAAQAAKPVHVPVPPKPSPQPTPAETVPEENEDFS